MVLQDLVIFKNEPVLNWLSSKRLFAKDRKTAPITVGVAFLLVVSLPLTAIAILFDSIAHDKLSDAEYISYLENFSWSISMIYLYPLIVGLIYKYYLSVPHVLGKLLESLVSGISKNSIEEYNKSLDKRFNRPYIWLAILIAVFAANLLYFYQIIENSASANEWMTYSENTVNILVDTGLTPAGMIAFFVQGFLLYFVFTFVVKTIGFIYTLYEFFSSKHFNVELDPLHFDGVCGLRQISKIDTQQAYILFLLGIYLSFKVIDKLIVQDKSLFCDIGNPALLGSYALLAPFMFFLPLASAHNKMEQAKDRFLKPISDKISQLMHEISGIQNHKESAQYLDIVKEVEGLHMLYKRKIPVWPFDVKSVQGFFSMVVMPLLPVLIPILFNFFKT